MKLILACIIVMGTPLIAMEAPEQNQSDLADELEQKCVVFIQEPSVTSQEQAKLLCILERRKQEQALLLERLKQKILAQQILPFQAEVSIQDLTKFASRNYIIRKTITVKLTQEKLVPCQILVHNENLETLLKDPLIKKHEALSLDSIEGELKWYVFRDYHECMHNPEKLKTLPY